MSNGGTNNQKSGNQLSSGLIMIAIGVIFLINQYTSIRINNWWAIFILIPALFNWYKAYKIVQETGAFTQGAVQTLLASLFPLFIAAIFFFDMDWGKVWPVFIILGGITALGNDWGRQ